MSPRGAPRFTFYFLRFTSSGRLQIRVPRDEFLLAGAIEVDRQAGLVAGALLRQDHAEAVPGVPHPPAAAQSRRFLLLLGLSLEVPFEDPAGRRRAFVAHIQNVGRDFVEETGGAPRLDLPVDEAPAGGRQRQLVFG